MTTDDLRIEATVRAASAQGRFDIELVFHDRTGRAGAFGGIGVSLKASTATYHVAIVDPAGRCSFASIPAGEWELVPGQAESSGLGTTPFPLPVPTGEAAHLAATTDRGLRVLAPSGNLLFVLRAGDRDDFVIEVVRAAAPEPAIVELAYGTSPEPIRRVLVPLPASPRRSSSIVRMDGFVPGRSRWQASEALPLTVLTDLTPTELTAAVRGAAPETRGVWSAIAELVPSVPGKAITDGLIGGSS